MPPPFATTLEDPYQRFLASLTEHGLELGLRTAEDFIRHFSPRVIMSALESDAALRATLLEEAVGIKRKVGLRKSPASAGDDLQIALDEGVTSAPAIVEIFTADERARHLAPSDLWAYLTESEFWHATRDDEHWPAARDHVAFFLESALANALLTPRAIVEGVTLARLVHHLPEPVLESILAAALQQARIHEPFSEDEMMFVATAAVLAEHVPLVDLWESVVTTLAPNAAPRGSRKASPPPAKTPIASSPTRTTTEMAVPVVPATASPLDALEDADEAPEESDARDEPVDEDDERMHSTGPIAPPPKLPGRAPAVPLPPGKPVPRPPGAMGRPSLPTPEVEGSKRSSRRPR